ncbi:hypothetical protein [Paenibacillus xylanilyticus]|uniref:hypothetical protein n=1 Tax=Paenibacillus xylanilyticus TaxID=248903 RepID=UPI0039A23D34
MNLYKYIRSLLLFIILIAVLTGCGGLSKKESEAYYQKAIPIGQEYFQTYYDEDVIFTDYDINLPMSSSIVLYGHVKDDSQTSLSLSLNLPSMEVRSASGPGEFIDKRKSEEEVNSQRE